MDKYNGMTRTQLRRKWMKALRAPDAKQCRNTLATPDGGRCCLGVLCDVAGLPIERHCEVMKYREKDDASYIKLPPPELTEFVGLVSRHGDNRKGKGQSLACANDAGVPFQTIAKRLATGRYWRRDK